MDDLYCIWRGPFIGGKDPPRAGGTKRWRLGEVAARGGCTSPNPNPNGLCQPIRVSGGGG
jgi:hypothetical protein